MKSVLLDENLPQQLRALLKEFTVVTVAYAGWSGKKNGDLLRSANGQFDVLLTVDKGIKYQNNFTGLNIAVVIMEVRSNQIRDIVPILAEVKKTIGSIQAGMIVKVSGP